MDGTDRRPHIYQLNGFYHGFNGFYCNLLSNLFVCISTGKGEMFIDALVIARIKILNPRKLIAFVVERIPLVFQQTRALSMDTDLSLCKLCSENRTLANVKKLLGRSFDVLFETV
jgi:hypothetical protein